MILFLLNTLILALLVIIFVVPWVLLQEAKEGTRKIWQQDYIIDKPLKQWPSHIWCHWLKPLKAAMVTKWVNLCNWYRNP